MRSRYSVRNTRREDFPAIAELSRVVYPETAPWGEPQLASHLKVFPDGQFVAVENETGRIAGMAASLILLWDDYDMDETWRDFTDGGYFTNHDSQGRTLYGAEIMVRPDCRGQGVGKLIYQARRELTRRLGLLRIRAGARLRDYHRYADRMGVTEYVQRVVAGEISDRTLSFQLKRGFHVLTVVSGYLSNDQESLGYAAIIEWINDKVAKPQDYEAVKQAPFQRALS